MRSGHKMTIWEAENFLNQTSDVSRSLTDPWELDPAKEYDYEGNPTGVTHELPFNADTLLQTIMLKGGELGVLFNNVATYYKMNKSWWDKWKPTFQKWWEVEEMDYNPMWDRDGRRRYHEDTLDAGYSDTTTHDKEDMTDTSKDTTTTNFDSTVHTEGTSDTTNKVSAYDAGDTLQTHDASHNDHKDDTTTHSTTVTESSSKEDRTTTADGTNNNKNGNDRDVDHDYREWGQWGISTISQNMYALQIKVRYENNLYEKMSDIFIKEMTDGVWV